MPATEKKAIRSILSRLGLEFRDRMEVSKLNISAIMRPNVPLKIRTWACIQVKACGYNQQLAVTQIKAEIKGERKIVPVTPGAIAGELNKATLQTFADAGHVLDDETRKALKIRKEHISRALGDLEDEGYIVRFVANCQPHKLVDLTMDEAAKLGLGRLLCDLPLGARKRCGNRVFVYLLPRPRPYKNIDLNACLELASRRREVITGGNLGHPKPNEINGGFVQMCFSWANEYGLTDEQAEELMQRPKIQKAMAAIAKRERALELEKERLKQVFASAARAASPKPAPEVSTQEPLFAPPAPELVRSQPQALSNPTGNGTTNHPPAGEGAETPLVSQPRHKVAAEFNEALCLRFRSVRANLPTQKQTDAILSKLGDQAEVFLSWLSPNEMHRRRPRHGGVLPQLLEEFQKLQAILADEQAARREPTREENLAYLRREWPGMTDSERQEYLAAFPELAEQRSASGD